MEASWPAMGPSYTHTHTHSCISLHTHAHTHVDSPSPADTLGHMHTGAAHSPLHTDTPTPAPAPTCTHLHPPHLQHSASVSCLLPGKDSARRVQAAAAWSGAVRLGEGFRARSSTPPPHPGSQGCAPASACWPAGLTGPPLVQGGGLGEGFGAWSSPPGSQDRVPTAPCGTDGPPRCREAGWGRCGWRAFSFSAVAA